jgi:hypothetical protein
MASEQFEVTGALATLLIAAIISGSGADADAPSVSGGASSHAAQPGRVALNNTVISRHDPAVEIRLPNSAVYVGADRFVLTDPHLGKFDDCELYAFIEPDDHRALRELYWVQFEAYLPSHPELQHTYDSPRHVTLGGLDFYLDTWVAAKSKPPEPGSDTAHFYSLLASRGYGREDLMSVRLVHLTDATKRRELMIIYSESLVPTGYTAAQLKEGGADHAKWEAIEDGLIRRAEQNITIKRDNDPDR